MARNQSESNFVEGLKGNLSNTINAIANHPYLYALEINEIRRVKLEIFVCEQYHIVTNDKRNFEFRLSKMSGDAARKLFKYCVEAELNALKNLTLMSDELAIDKSKIESYEVLAGCQAYSNYLTRLVVYGSDAELLTALLIDLPVWGANCSKMSTLLKKNYGFGGNSCLFLDKFASPLPQQFVSKSKEIIDFAILHHEKSLCTAARLIIGYELLFWDTIYKCSINY
jgi:thiaminase